MPIWSCLTDRSIEEKRAGFIAGFFLYYSRDPSRGSGMGVSGTPRQEEYTRLTQLWGQPGSLGLEINTNKELTRCIQMVIIKFH